MSQGLLIVYLSRALFNDFLFDVPYFSLDLDAAEVETHLFLPPVSGPAEEPCVYRTLEDSFTGGIHVGKLFSLPQYDYVALVY